MGYKNVSGFTCLADKFYTFTLILRVLLVVLA